MSPEQALGRTIDFRTDLFSYGAVLYEMATGSRAFRGDTAAAVFNSILHEEPVPPARLNPRIPPELNDFILRALQKQLGSHYQSASQVRCELESFAKAARSS